MVKFQKYLPGQNSQYTTENSHKPELCCSHRMLENPERILKSETSDAETIVQKGKQKVEKHRQKYRAPVNDCLK